MFDKLRLATDGRKAVLGCLIGWRVFAFPQTLRNHLAMLSFAYFSFAKLRNIYEKFACFIFCTNVKKPFGSVFFCLLFFFKRKVGASPYSF
ncbi:MAG: hypothetical protein IJX94_00915 [Clostridia bacterium]|nr:hypothetical protein [Clostridia bacterium]